MALKSTICGIVHHKAEPKTMVSNFKNLSGQSTYLGFAPELVIYIEKNLDLWVFTR